MIYRQPIHILDARRSPVGKFGGALKDQPAPDLAEQVASAMVPAELAGSVDSVILGQVLQAGCGMNTARQVGLRLGLPHGSPAWMVNMVCGSGLKAVAEAADRIAAGGADLVLAGGVENMSRAPYLDLSARWGRRFGDAGLADSILTDGLSDPFLKVSMGETAERVAAAADVSREEQDRFALQSHKRAIASRESFAREIVPIQVKRGQFSEDEHPRPDTTLEKLASLAPAFRPDGTVTAGNSSGINDGAALLLVGSETAAQRHGLASRARIIGASAVGCDPATMGLGPVHAIRALIQELQWEPASIPVIEINEAFAAQVLACAKQLGLGEDRLNLRGGGVALGHPIGCSGARVLVTLLHIMEDHDFPRGIASLCIGGGMGIAMAIERHG